MAIVAVSGWSFREHGAQSGFCIRQNSERPRQKLSTFSADMFAAVCKLFGVDVFIMASEAAEGNRYFGPVHPFWAFGFTDNSDMY